MVTKRISPRAQELIILAGILVIFSLAVIIIEQPQLTGLVTLEPQTLPGTIFTISSINITCSAASEEELVNISATITGPQTQTLTEQISGNNAQTHFTFDNLLSGSYTYACTACDEYDCTTSLPLPFTVNLPIPSDYRGVVLNITFDDQNNPWKDYSPYDHQLTPGSALTWIDKDEAKWYGGADMTPDSNTDLKTTAKWNEMDGFAASWWMKPVRASSGNTMGFFAISTGGSNEGTVRLYDEGYGVVIDVILSDGSRVRESSTTSKSIAHNWVHLAAQYNPTDGLVLVWKDGVLVMNRTVSSGIIEYEINRHLSVGSWQFSQRDIDGYLDEFLFWNYPALNDELVQDLYNSQKLETPPQTDMYVESVKYELPINWGDSQNRLIQETTMPIAITIKNQGVMTANEEFQVQFVLQDEILQTWTIRLDAGESDTIIYNWQTSYGFHEGLIIIDPNNVLEEDNKNNNVQKVFIPYMNRPWFHFNSQEWESTLKPYMLDTTNEVAYDSYSWIRHGGCSSFNEAYTGDSIDPYGKYSRACAMTCLVNNYNSDKCNTARDHLFGWASRSLDTYSQVQNVHELAHLGMAYDVMFPTLTQEQHEYLSEQYHAICQHITNLPGVRPDLDDKDAISGDNGQGFGSGMGAFCYSLLGAYKENPTLIHQLSDQYYGTNLADEWMSREQKFLNSFKNDSYAHYEEGWNYKFYAQYHIIENLWFEKRYGLNNLEEYQNALCSMAREIITDTTDFVYNGNTLRNNRDQRMRGIQRGDSFSYAHPADGSYIGFSAITYYGLLCDDPDVKKSILYLRKIISDINDDGLNSADAWLYGLLATQVDEIPIEIDSINSKVLFDNANDILTIRTNYTYVDDTIIQIDGGEERGNGHSNAQGYYLYALGEPFLDYEQVPYEDDVKAETWKNGISLQNDIQTVEGQTSFYSQNCGHAPLNQYYGMSNCPPKYFSTDYPDYRRFPLEYGGDVEDYVGSKDAYFAGAYVWRPYKNAAPVKEYFVKFGDLLAKRTVVSGVTQGAGIYHNFINIAGEFTEARTGNNLVFTRNNKHLDINVLYSTQTLSLQGGVSPINYCFGKTSCQGHNRGLGTYRRTYLYTNQNNLDFILGHHWYVTGQRITQQVYGSSDKGIRHGNNIVVFDTNNNGLTQAENIETDGWALAFSDDYKKIGVFNASYLILNGYELFTSNMPLSIYFELSEEHIAVYPNTMRRSIGIDFPQTVSIIVDARSLNNNAGFSIQKDGQAVVKDSEHGTTLTFNVIGGQVPTQYLIAGSGSTDASPQIIQTSPPPNHHSMSPGVSFECSASDDYQVSSLSLLINSSAVHTLSGSTDELSLTHTHTLPDGTYEWRCQATDNSSQTTLSPFRTLIVGGQNNPPAVTSLLPINDQVSTSPVLFSCQATDTDLQSISLWTNTTGVWAQTYSVAASGSFGALQTHRSFEPNTYSWACSATDEQDQTTFTTNRSLTIIPSQSPPVATLFDGHTTNFSSLPSFENQTNITLENTSSALVTFTGTISSLYGIDFDQAINLSNLSVTVHSDLYPELNVSAQLLFHNVPFENPVVLMNGEPCTVCSQATWENTSYRVSVEHFSTFMLIEEPDVPNPPSNNRGGGGGSSGGISGAVVTPPVQEEQPSSVETEQQTTTSEDPPVLVEEEPVVQEQPVREQPRAQEEKEPIFGGSSTDLPAMIMVASFLLVTIVLAFLFLQRKPPMNNTSYSRSIKHSSEKQDSVSHAMPSVLRTTHKPFVFHTGERFHSVKDLAQHISSLSHHQLSHHTKERHDIAHWVHDVFGEQQLAQNISRVTNPRELADILESAVMRAEHEHKLRP